MAKNGRTKIKPHTMTDKLKSAIITIAEYMGYTVYPNDATIMLSSMSHQKFENLPPYSTSADALLEVWRKVRDDKDFVVGYNKAITKYKRQEAVSKILWLIGNGDYPLACELLAEIINELKKKV